MRRLAPAVLSGLALLYWPGSLAARAQPDLIADVALDPAHHRLEVGASNGELREFELDLEIALRARELLEARGVLVRLTRTDHEPLSAWSDPDPIERIRIEQAARIAAAGPARAYVSINFNGLGDPRISGTETYYNPDNLGEQAYRLAEALQRNVVGALWEVGYPARDRGVKSDLLAGKPYGHFFGLRGPMPSAVVEGLFLTNWDDAAALKRDDVRQAMAEGYARGIAEYLASTSRLQPASSSYVGIDRPKVSDFQRASMPPP